MDERLVHVSEEGGIEWFEPRRPPSGDCGVGEAVVFAIREGMVHNYLLPRDCPRVTFYMGPRSRREDGERLMGSGRRFVVAIEEGWGRTYGRMGVWAYGRIGVWAYGRMGVWASGASTEIG